jgi:hypothetical protein
MIRTQVLAGNGSCGPPGCDTEHAVIGCTKLKPVSRLQLMSQVYKNRHRIDFERSARVQTVGARTRPVV